MVSFFLFFFLFPFVKSRGFFFPFFFSFNFSLIFSLSFSAFQLSTQPRAISTPTSEQYAGDGIAGRGPAYGIPARPESTAGTPARSGGRQRGHERSRCGGGAPF